jgi:hypothetical protein
MAPKRFGFAQSPPQLYTWESKDVASFLQKALAKSRNV